MSDEKYACWMVESYVPGDVAHEQPVFTFAESIPNAETVVANLVAMGHTVGSPAYWKM